MRILRLAVLVVAVAGVWAWRRGWHTADPAKIEHDATQEAATLAASLERHAVKIEQLARHGELASPEQKAAIADQVRDFRHHHGEIADKLERMKTASGAEASALEGDVRSSLDRSHAELDRALESARPK